MSSLAKNNDRIRIGRAEIEVNAGEKPKHISLTDLEEEKQKNAFGGKKGGDASKVYKQINSIDTLYSLFLNHLLRPKEWSA